jgi:hypothetical protein
MPKHVNSEDYDILYIDLEVAPDTYKGYYNETNMDEKNK